MQKLREIFESVDTNGDGAISKKAPHRVYEEGYNRVCWDGTTKNKGLD